MSVLAKIHADIDARVTAIRSAHPDWLCGKGCDACCRRLAELPRLSTAEWRLLRSGLETLAPERLAEVRQALAALTENPDGFVVCPLLEQSTGACPVYAQRPVACRSYGFYVQRDRGLHCRDIEAQVAAGSLAGVVWGNHDVIDQELAKLGTARPLNEWFTLWAQEDAAAARTAQLPAV